MLLFVTNNVSRTFSMSPSFFFNVTATPGIYTYCHTLSLHDALPISAYDFATDRAAIFLNEYARSNDPFAGIGQRSVSVQVTSVVRASDNSFQVKWTESIFERGSLARTEHWTAMLTVVMRPPKAADALRKNPLGLFVNAIDWARELEGAPTTKPANKTQPPPPTRLPHPMIAPGTLEPNPP